MKLTILATIAAFVSAVVAGPIGIAAYGRCQTGCNTLAVACYNAAGSTFGTVTAEDASPALVACNGALGTCHQACANVTLAVSTS